MLIQKTTALANAKSKGTLSQQDNLLQLPLPSLSDTVNKWLPTTVPHLTEEEFKKTHQVAQDFIKQAEPMQNYLKEKSLSKGNWVINYSCEYLNSILHSACSHFQFADWWLDMAYLEYRDPLCVWSSPGLVLPHFDFGNV